MKVLVIGAGLMGGSVALALKNAGHQVALSDSDPQIEQSASAFLKISTSLDSPDVVVVAVPPSAVGKVIIEANRSFSNATLIDIASVMGEPLLEVESSGQQIFNWIPSHPMAGKESGGFKNASFDLFQDRLWVISPQAETSLEHLERAKKVIQDCGALLFEMDGSTHDKTVSVTSHLPQILATSLAKQLNELPDDSLKVSGQGLRDLTRIASSSGSLWQEILLANKKNVKQSIENLMNDLHAITKAIDEENSNSIIQYFELGNKGKERIPGKHGGEQQKFVIVSIEIDDKPGQLAGIFSTAGAANVNIEDVRIDHALGKEIAIIELSVHPSQEKELKAALLIDGWKLRATSFED